MDEAALITLLTTLVQKVDALERRQADVRPSPFSEVLEGAVSPQPGVGQQPPQRMDPSHPQWPPGGGAIAPSPALYDGTEWDDPRHQAGVSNRVAPRQRDQSAPVPRSGVDFALDLSNAAGRYSPAPPPHEAAYSGQEFLQATSDEYIQVRSEDGKLLGCMPTFGDIQQVHTQRLQTLNVGMVAVRTVVVPYNQGINPYEIHGFIPIPSLPNSALSTIDSTDPGRAV